MPEQAARIDVVDQLPQLLGDILDAERALQSLTLGRRGVNGEILPFLFSSIIKARFGFEGVVNKEKHIFFGLINSSNRTKKVADLRFKFELSPGESQQNQTLQKLTFCASVPAFLNYRRSNKSLHIREPGIGSGWEIVASQGAIIISLIENLNQITTETASLLLSKSILDWKETPKRKINFVPVSHKPADDEERTHFSELLLVQQRVFESLAKFDIQTIQNESELTHINPGNYCSVLGNNFVLDRFRTDILATISSFGYLTTKGEASEGQQFDVRTELNDIAGNFVDMSLEIPDLLTSGEIYQRFTDAVVKRYRVFIEALDGLKGTQLNSPRIMINKDFFLNLAAANNVQFVRIEQDFDSDTDLIWMRDLGDSQNFDFLFAASVSVEAYPSRKLPRLSNVCLLAEIDRTTPGKPRVLKLKYASGDRRRHWLRNYFEKIENHQKRLFGAILHLFDYIDSTRAAES